MHEELWGQLEGLERETTARRAKCEYLSESDSYVIRLLEKGYVVHASTREIDLFESGGEGESANFVEQLCILAYLINSRDLPAANELVKPEAFVGGEFFFRGPHLLPNDKLVDAFGANPALLYEAGGHFNAKKCDFGDASIELFILPRITVTLIIWGSDEEFAARSSILFDRTAPQQMPLDALQAAVKYSVSLLIKSLS